MASPIDVASVFASFVQMLPYILLIALLPTLIKSVVEAFRSFRA